MGLRSKWEFAVPASELQSHAAERVEHHTNKVKEYQEKADERRQAYIESVEEAARKATDHEKVQAEALATQLANEGYAHNQGSTQMLRSQPKQIIGDAEILADLQRAEAKIAEHREKVRTYEMWVKLLAREGSGRQARELDIEDAHFFGL